MNYLNLSIQSLSSEEFIGSQPVDRATWLCLMRYCAHQENGGRIKGVGKWPERKLIGLLSVMENEIKKDCKLWSWAGQDLIVTFYPLNQQIACKAKREAGKSYGKGHPKDNDS